MQFWDSPAKPFAAGTEGDAKLLPTTFVFWRHLCTFLPLQAGTARLRVQHVRGKIPALTPQAETYHALPLTPEAGNQFKAMGTLMRCVRKVKAGLMTVKIFLIIPSVFSWTLLLHRHNSLLFNLEVMVYLVEPHQFYKQQSMCDVVTHVSKCHYITVLNSLQWIDLITLTNLFTYHPEMSIWLKKQGLDIEQWVMTSWSALRFEEL